MITYYSGIVDAKGYPFFKYFVRVEGDNSLLGNNFSLDVHLFLHRVHYHETPLLKLMWLEANENLPR